MNYFDSLPKTEEKGEWQEMIDLNPWEKEWARYPAHLLDIDLLAPRKRVLNVIAGRARK